MRIAVIPARGGSKRIPRKNLVDFCGKPMIAWTIEAALGSAQFDTVLVSTEDEEIAQVARKYGADVPFLRQRYHDDLTPVSAVVLDVLEQLKSRFGKEYNQVVQLMANCPLRTSRHIEESISNFNATGFEFQLSCTRFGWLNPWWAFRLNETGPEPLFPQALQQRSQDLAPLYCPSGAVWIATTQALLRDASFYGRNFQLYPLDWRAAIDIDEPEDLEFARAICSAQLEG